MVTKNFGKRLVTVLLSVSLLLSSSSISVLASETDIVSSGSDSNVSTTENAVSGNDVSSDTSAETSSETTVETTADTDIGVEGGTLSSHLSDVVVEGGEINPEDDKSGGSFGGGDGTALTPYLIEDADDLIAMQPIINSSANNHKYFKLANDIDLSGLTLSDFDNNYGFTSLVSLSPSSSDPNVFFELDGNGYGITGLDVSVASTDDIDAIGIFGYINASSIIKNVTFSSCAVSVGNKSVAAAAIVAVQNFGIITDCMFSGLTVDFTPTYSDNTNTLFNSETITLSSQNVYSGVAAVAADNKGTITSSQASNITVKVWGDRRYIGAIVGQNRYNVSDISESNVVIHSYGSSETSSSTTAFTTVPTGAGNVSRYVGGVAGYNRASTGISSPMPTISDCTISITGFSTVNFASGDYVGGICGYNAGEVTDGMITGSFSNSGSEPNAATADMTGYGRMGGIAGANTGTVESSTSYNIGAFFTDDATNSAFGGVVGENAGGVIGCVSSGYAYDNGETAVGIGGVAGSVLTGSSLSNCYTFIKVTTTTNNSGAVIGKGGTVSAVSTCRWTSAASGTSSACAGVGVGYNDLNRPVNVLNIADGVDVTVPKTSMTHSWSGTGVATVSMNNAANNATVSGSGITLSDAGTSFTVSSSTVSASGTISYSVNVSFPSGVGASSASMALRLSMPVFVTDTTTTDMSASPKVFAGTSSSYPILISSYTELQFILAAPDAHFMLSSDITMGSGWTAVDFRGTLDGNDKTITANANLFKSITGSRNESISISGWETDTDNLSKGYVHDLVVSSSSTLTGSMFGDIEDATLMGVTYSGSGAVTLPSSNSGAFVGTLAGSCYLYECYTNIAANITAETDSTGIAALIGRIAADNFIVDNCGSSSVVTLTNNLSGAAGLIGTVASMSGKGTISNCYATGKVRVSSSVTASAKVVIGTITSAVHTNTNFEVSNVKYSVSATSDSGYTIATASSNYNDGITIFKFSVSNYEIGLSGGTKSVTLTMPSGFTAWSTITTNDFNIGFADSGKLSAGTLQTSGSDFSFELTSITPTAFSTTMTVTHSASGLKARVTVRSGLSQNADGYIEIYTPQDLVAFSSRYGSTYAVSSKVMLCADIDMNDGTTNYNTSMTRLAKTVATAFTGEFVGKLGENGEKPSISNLQVANTNANLLLGSGGEASCGFFGNAIGATFKNFAMLDCTVDNASNGTGILVGCADEGSSSTTGCSFENIDIIGGYAKSSVSSGGVIPYTVGFVGGLVGAIRSTATTGNPYVFKNIYIKDITVGFTTSTLAARNSSVGGLIGGCVAMKATLTIGEDVNNNNDEPSIIVDNIYASGYQYVGGVIGTVSKTGTGLFATVTSNSPADATTGSQLVVNGVEVRRTDAISELSSTPTETKIEGKTAGGGVGGILGVSCGRGDNSIIKNSSVDSATIIGVGTSNVNASSCSGGIAGFFAGEISNCTVDDSSITGLVAGGIVARAARTAVLEGTNTVIYARVTVTNCEVLGDTTVSRGTIGTESNSRAGGIVAAAAGTEVVVEGCGVGKGVSVKLAAKSGGIIGEVVYNTDITGLAVKNTVSYAVVENKLGTDVLGYSAGGVIGYINADYNSVSISGYNAVVENCFIGGEVNNNTSQYAGGIIGYYYYSTTNSTSGNYLIKDCTVVAQIDNISSNAGLGGKIIGHVLTAAVLQGTSATYTVSGVVLSSFSLPDDHSTDNSLRKTAYGDSTVESDSGATATYVDINKPYNNADNRPLNYPDASPVVIDATPVGGVVTTTAEIEIQNQLSSLYIGYDTNARLIFNTGTGMTDYGYMTAGWRSLDNDAIEITSATEGTLSANAVIDVAGYENTDGTSGIYGAYNVNGLYIPGTDELVSIYVCVEVICQNFLDFNLSGSGTSGDPYIIMTKKELSSLRYAPSTGNNYDDVYFELGADITFSASDFVSGGSFYNSGALFKPIGYDSATPTTMTVFTGHLSGKRTSTGVQHYISGLQINSDSTHCGLFAQSDGAVFTDLYFTDTTITSNASAASLTNCYTAALVGYAEDTAFSNVNFDNTAITANASTTNVRGYAGTLAAYVVDSTADGCGIVDSTIESASYIGGVFGHGHQSTSLTTNTIIDTVVTGLNVDSSDIGVGTIKDIGAGVAGEYSGVISNVTVNGTGTINGGRASGVVGLLCETGYNHLTISDTTVNGVISIVSESTGSDTAAAGIVAKIKNSQEITPTSEALLIDGCTVSNKVSIAAQYNAGGLIGSCQSLSGATPSASIIITDSSSFATVVAEDSNNGTSAYMLGSAAAVISYIYTGTVLQISNVTAGGTVKGAKYAAGVIAEIVDGSLQTKADTLVDSTVISAKIGYTSNSRQPSGCCLGLVIASVTASVLPTGVTYTKDQFVNLYYSTFQNDSIEFTGNSTINASTSPDFDATVCDVQDKVFYYDTPDTPTKIILSSDPLTLTSSNVDVNPLNGSSIGSGESFAGFTAPTDVSFKLAGIDSRDESGSSSTMFTYNTLNNVMTPGSIGSGYAVLVYGNGIEVGIEITVNSGGGSGTIDDPYLIDSIEDLEMIRNNENDDRSCYYAITDDIDFTGYNSGDPAYEYEFIPEFTGHLTGCYNSVYSSILNLIIDNTESTLTGFFGTIASGASVEDLGFENCTVTGAGNVGMLAGTSAGTVSGITVSGSDVSDGFFVPTGSYTAGDVVCYYSDSSTYAYYACKLTYTYVSANASTYLPNASSSAYWTKIGDWSSSSGYAIGTHCLYSGTVYVAITTISASATFQTASWSAVTVATNTSNVGGIVGSTTTVIDGCTVNSLTSDSGSVIGGLNVGGIVGYTTANVTNCKISGETAIAAGDLYIGYAGGIVGLTSAGASGCAVESAVISSGNYAGGIVGFAQATNATMTFSTCTVGDGNASETVTVTAANYAGGVTGTARGNSSAVTPIPGLNITDCIVYSDVDVTSENGSAAGILAYLHQYLRVVSITGCESYADVTATHAADTTAVQNAAAGILAFSLANEVNVRYLTIQNCVGSGSLKAYSYVGGILGYFPFASSEDSNKKGDEIKRPGNADTRLISDCIISASVQTWTGLNTGVGILAGYCSTGIVTTQSPGSGTPFSYAFNNNYYTSYVTTLKNDGIDIKPFGQNLKENQYSGVVIYDVAKNGSNSSFSVNNNQWMTGEGYEVGEVILHAGVYYVCVSAHISSGASFSPASTDWKAADVWTSSSSYLAGDVCLYGDTVYSSLTGHTSTIPPSADATNWSNVTVLENNYLWIPSTSYSVDDIIYYNGNFYVCATAHTSGITFSATNWTAVSAWVASTSYALGAYCSYNYAVYKATTAHTSSSAFMSDSASWSKQTSITFGYSYKALVLPYDGAAIDNSFQKPSSIVFTSANGTNDMALSATSDITVYTDGGSHVRTIKVNDIYATNNDFYSDSLTTVDGRRTSVLTAVENEDVCSECDLIVDLGYGLIVGVPVSAYKTGLVSNGNYGTPYVIHNEQEFVDYFFGEGATGSYLSNYYLQAADLDFTTILSDISALGKTFKPLGYDENNMFTGGYDGGGYRITNFTYSGGTSDYCGLFGYVNDRSLSEEESMLSNIHIELASGGVSGDAYVGGLVGYYSSNSGITNCSVVYSTVSGSDKVGGLVGYMKDGALTGCFTSSDVMTTDYASASVKLTPAGGLIGYYDYTSTNGAIVIDRCFSSSDVLASYYASGLVGKVAYSTTTSHGNIYLTDCYFTGSVCAYYLFNQNGTDYPVSLLVGHLAVYPLTISKAASTNNEYVLAQDVYVAGTNVSQYIGNVSNYKYYPVLFGTSQEIESGTVDGVSYESRNIYYDARIVGTISVDTAANTTSNPDIILADTGEFTDNNRGDTANNAVGSWADTNIKYAVTSDLTNATAKFGSSVWSYSDTGSYPVLSMLDDYADAFCKVSAMPLFIDERETRDVSDMSYCGITYATEISDTVHNADSSEATVIVSSSVYSQSTDTIAYNSNYDINLYGNGSGGSAVKTTDFLFRNKTDDGKISILRNSCFTRDTSKSRNIQTPFVTLSATVDGYSVSRNIRLTFRAATNSYYISTERQLRAIMNSQSGGTENDGTEEAVPKFEVYKSALLETSNVYLCSDIELNGDVTFTPIAGFYGNFDGMDCDVSNLYISQSGTNNIGFFATISSAQKNISSITFNNVKITGQNNVGTLIGMVDGSPRINNCVVNTIAIDAYENNPSENTAYIPVDECVVTGVQNVGGLIGMMKQGTIGDWGDATKNNSEQASGTDVSVKGQRCVGGFVGAIVPVTAAESTSIMNCFAKGDVSSVGNITVDTNAPNYYSFGGFVGSAKRNAGNTTSLINYAFATGDVTVGINAVTNTTNAYRIGVGGFCGVTEVNLQNCFSSGGVTVTSGNIKTFPSETINFRLGVGGLVGSNVIPTEGSGATISNSYSSSPVTFNYESTTFDNSGYSIVGVGGVCGLSQYNVTKVYSSGSIVMSHVGSSAFRYMFYGASVGYITNNTSGATVSKTYYDSWTNNIANLTALGGNQTYNDMSGVTDGGDYGIDDTSDVRGYTTDEFCDGTVIGDTKLPGADWGANNNAYPYLKAMFKSEVSEYIRYPAVLSVIAVRPNERDITARTNSRGYSMALTMPDAIVITDTNSQTREYSISWNVPDSDDAVKVINSGGNIYAPVRTSNDAQYLSLIAWVTGYEESEDYDSDGVTVYDNDGATDGYREFAERDVDKLYQRMDGTSDYPYLISSVLDLEYIHFANSSGWISTNTDFRAHWFSPMSGGANIQGKVYYKLITNIDMTQDVYVDGGGNTVVGTPGSNTTPYVVNAISAMAGNIYYPDLNNTGSTITFQGLSIDGNDYIIKNYDSSSPFINTLDSTSELKDILFMDVNIDNGGSGSSAIVGINNGTVDGLMAYNNGSTENVIVSANGNAAAIAAVNNGTIKNCVANTNVEATGTDAYAGGIAAVNNGTIQRSTSAGIITAGTGVAAVGGIAGINNSGKSITTSFTSGGVVGNASSLAGGLVGQNDGAITTAASRATVNGYYDTVNTVNLNGSLVGKNSGTVSNAYAAGQMTVNSIPSTVQGSALTGSNTGTITNSYADKALLGSSAYMLLGDVISTEDLFDTAFTGFTTSDNDAYPQISDIVNILTVESYVPGAHGDYELLKYQLLKAYSVLNTVTIDSEYAQYINTLTTEADNVVTTLDSDDYSITTGEGPTVADVNGGSITSGTDTVTATIKDVTVSGAQVSPIRTKATAGETNVSDETGFYPSFTLDYSCGAQNPNFYDGSGTQADPYQINNSSSFESLAYYGLAPEAYFIMIDDVSFGGSEPYEPITLLAGKLDGDHYTVSDIELTNNNGLFGEITGKVSDLGLVGITLETAGEDGGNYGLLAAKATGAEIGGTYAVGTLIISQGATPVSTNVGGLVGYMNTSQIHNSVSSGKIVNECTGGSATVGGIAGLVSGTKTVDGDTFSITDSESTAYVYGLVAVGGIAGRAGSSAIIANVIFAGTAADSGLLSTTVSGGETVPSKTPDSGTDVSNILGVNDSCTVANAYYDKQLALYDSEALYNDASTFDLLRLSGMTGAFTLGNGWAADSGTIKKYYPSPMTKSGSDAFIAGLNFATVRLTVSLAGNEGSVYCYDNINVPTPVYGTSDTVSLTENRTGFSDSNYYLSPTGASDSKAPGSYLADFTSIDVALNTSAGSAFAGNTTDIQRYAVVWIIRSILVEYEIVAASGSGFGASDKLALLVSPTTDGFGVAANAQTSINQSTGSNGANQVVYQKMVLVDDNGSEGVYVDSILPEGFEIDNIEWYPGSSTGNTDNADKSGNVYFIDLAAVTDSSIHMTVTVDRSAATWGVDNVWNSISATLS